MDHRDPRAARQALAVLVTALVMVGCGSTVTPSPPPTLETTPVPATDLTCPEAVFDPTASLGPAFANDIFVEGESEVIARAFIDGLSGLYARRPAADPCAWFSARGLRTAMETDPRLRDAIEGRSTVQAALELRVAFEGTYDLRRTPPTVPLSIVFDLPAGSRTTDQRSGTTTRSAGTQRAGLAVDFVFDGHRWLADLVGPVEGGDAAWTVMPTPLPPGDPCTGLTRDPAGASFDDASGTDFLVEPVRTGRPWCDALGHGRVVDAAQIALVTRYPCGRGRAAVLTLGLPLGMPIDPLLRHEFVRDPAGEFLAEGWIAAPYEADTPVPADAASTGWTNGNVELWMSPGDLDAAVYMHVGGAIERWPRTVGAWGVIDCN